jgi:hypothetical protein
MLKLGAERILSYASQVPAGSPSSGDRACSVWHSCPQLAVTFEMAEVTIYNCLKQDLQRRTPPQRDCSVDGSGRHRG